jgi:hypothetical protein
MLHRAATQFDLFDSAVVIRRASEADEPVLARLAALDSALPLRGEALVAFVDGEPWAAVSLEDGRVVADPFRPSAGAVELLRVRARHLGTSRLPPRATRRVLGLRRASA